MNIKQSDVDEVVERVLSNIKSVIERKDVSEDYRREIITSSRGKLGALAELGLITIPQYIDLVEKIRKP
jgi:hypothetical protein